MLLLRFLLVVVCCWWFGLLVCVCCGLDLRFEFWWVSVFVFWVLRLRRLVWLWYEFVLAVFWVGLRVSSVRFAWFCLTFWCWFLCSLVCCGFGFGFRLMVFLRLCAWFVFVALIVWLCLFDCLGTVGLL